MKKFEQIHGKEIDSFIKDKETTRKLKYTKEPVFKINHSNMEIKIPDQLVDIEISLRKCKRVGVFRR